MAHLGTHRMPSKSGSNEVSGVSRAGPGDRYRSIWPSRRLLHRLPPPARRGRDAQYKSIAVPVDFALSLAFSFTGKRVDSP